jgi:hypothetical protein
VNNHPGLTLRCPPSARWLGRDAEVGAEGLGIVRAGVRGGRRVGRAASMPRDRGGGWQGAVISSDSGLFGQHNRSQPSMRYPAVRGAGAPALAQARRAAQAEVGVGMVLRRGLPELRTVLHFHALGHGQKMRGPVHAHRARGSRRQGLEIVRAAVREDQRP